MCINLKVKLKYLILWTIFTMSGLNIKEMIKNGELDLSSKGLKEIPVQQIVSNLLNMEWIKDN